MTRDELEFSISQYLDGALAAAERNALDERLATDVEARAILAEYESLQGVLVAAPMPEMNWDRLSAHLSAAVAQEELPAQSYRMGFWRRPLAYATAASVVIAAGIGFSLIKSTETPPLPEPTRIVLVDAPAADALASSANVPAEPIRIAIGPSTEAREEPLMLRYADSVVRRPSKAVIVSAAVVGQDSLMTPF